MKSIEKLYYHSDPGIPGTSDEETLDILDELASMEGDDDLKPPEPKN
jgi:hypothetical protein